jgi:mRNA interferase MazF
LPNGTTKRMPSTTNFKKWEIVLVPFPFTDLTSVKRRPAIIVSPDSYNAGNDVVITYVTSQLTVASRPGDYQIQKWKEAGLPKPSMVRMKFATVTKNIIVKTIGKLEIEDRERLEKIILAFFKL